MEEVKIWAVNGTSDVVPLEARNRVDTESLLEETLVNNPELLLPGLRLVGRQTPTEGGPLDLLGVDEDGRLVVFELKRGTLSRESVAQIIDYSSDLEAMDLVVLADHITDRSGEHGIEAIEDFQEWYGQDFGGLEGLKPLRMFLVGLGADDRTERMVRFLANNSGMDISLLTFHGFAYDGKTLLAKQVEIEGVSDLDGRSTSKYLNVAETRARFESSVEGSGVPELFGAVRGVFRETWQNPREAINAGSLRLSLRHHSEARWRAYARLAPEPGKVQLVFYVPALTLCPNEFEQAAQVIPSEKWASKKWPNWNELRFWVDSAGWEAHKERLTNLAQAVYEACKRRGQGGNSD